MKSPHQVAWSIRRLATGPTMIQVQPRTRPQRSIQLRSGRQRPIKSSVSQETTTAHPAWCASRTTPFTTNALIRNGLLKLNRPSSQAEPISSPLDRQDRKRRDCRDQPGLHEQSPQARTRGAEPCHEERPGPGCEAG